MRNIVIILGLLAVAAGPAADLLGRYASEAGVEDFSAEKGRQLYTTEHPTKNGAESCATCHGPDPRQQGRAARTGKAIEPLAPSANAKRFTDPAKVEKWFRRNCTDVLGRACTAAEKGEFITYLRSLK